MNIARIFADDGGNAFAAFVTFETPELVGTLACLVVGVRSQKQVRGGVEHASRLEVIPVDVSGVGAPPRLMWHLRRVREAAYFEKAHASRDASAWYGPCTEAFDTNPYVSSAPEARPSHPSRHPS